MQKVWRKAGEAVRVGSDIKVTVDKVRDGRVRLVIETPGGTRIEWLSRSEVDAEIAVSPLTTDVQPA